MGWSWTNLFGIDDNPVKGDPVEFRRAADDIAAKRVELEEALVEVDVMIATAGDGFEGLSADAFHALANAVVADHAEMPARLSEIEATLRGHGTELDELIAEDTREREAAEQAAVEESKAKETRDRRRGDLGRARRALDGVALDDPGRPLLEQTERDSERLFNQAVTAFSSAGDALGSFLGVHDRLSGDESRLNTATATALGESPLALPSDDRSWFERGAMALLPTGNDPGLVVADWLVGLFTPINTPQHGDLGGQFTSEERDPFSIDGADAHDRGIAAINQFLTDTGNPTQILNDEFEIVDHGDNTFTVVLPGVTDLSSMPAGFGLDPFNETVRDVDQYALRSATGSDVDDNEYAILVRRYLREELPAGANIMLVGHSYGGDTVADLAADSSFNGPDGFNVTHVVSAAYHSEPQLDHIPDHTEVLILQNDIDLPVLAERAFEHPNAAAHAAYDAVDAVFSGDPRGFAGSMWDGVTASGNMLWGVGSLANKPNEVVVNVVTNPVEIAQDVWNNDTSQFYADTIGFLPDAGVTQVTDSQIMYVFSGDGEGAGHHQNNYIAALNDHPDDAALTSFFESVDAAGYTTAGDSVAVDVSIR